MALIDSKHTNPLSFHCREGEVFPAQWNQPDAVPTTLQCSNTHSTTRSVRWPRGTTRGATRPTCYNRVAMGTQHSPWPAQASATSSVATGYIASAGWSSTSMLSRTRPCPGPLEHPQRSQVDPYGPGLPRATNLRIQFLLLTLVA